MYKSSYSEAIKVLYLWNMYILITAWDHSWAFQLKTVCITQKKKLNCFLTKKTCNVCVVPMTSVLYSSHFSLDLVPSINLFSAFCLSIPNSISHQFLIWVQLLDLTSGYPHHRTSVCISIHLLNRATMSTHSVELLCHLFLLL